MIGADTVIVSHYDEGGPVTLTEEAEVLIGLEGREFAGKRAYLNTVNSAGQEQFLLFLYGSQEPEFAGVLLQHRPRMRPESDHNGLLSPFTGRGDHSLQDMTVPQMDTVKKAGGYYSHLTHSKA